MGCFLLLISLKWRLELRSKVKNDEVNRWLKNRFIWIPPLNGNFKLNFDSPRVENRSVWGWVIGDFNSIIKMVVSRHMGNALIIVAKYMDFRDNMLAAKHNQFLNL